MAKGSFYNGLMVADIVSGHQRLIQITLDEFFGHINRCTYEDLDTGLIEQFNGTLTHATGDNNIGASIVLHPMSIHICTLG